MKTKTPRGLLTKPSANEIQNRMREISDAIDKSMYADDTHTDNVTTAVLMGVLIALILIYAICI